MYKHRGPHKGLRQTPHKSKPRGTVQRQARKNYYKYRSFNAVQEQTQETTIDTGKEQPQEATHGATQEANRRGHENAPRQRFWRGHQRRARCWGSSDPATTACATQSQDVGCETIFQRYSMKRFMSITLRRLGKRGGGWRGGSSHRDSTGAGWGFLHDSILDTETSGIIPECTHKN